MIYDYARVSKTGGSTRNQETQLHILREFEIREEHTFADWTTCSSTSRPAWNQLMTRRGRATTVVVARLDRFSWKFREDIKVLSKLPKPNIGLCHQGGHQHPRRQHRSQAPPQDNDPPLCLLTGVRQEAEKAGLEQARVEDRGPARLLALTLDQVRES